MEPDPGALAADAAAAPFEFVLRVAGDAAATAALVPPTVCGMCASPRGGGEWVFRPAATAGAGDEDAPAEEPYGAGAAPLRGMAASALAFAAAASPLSRETMLAGAVAAATYSWEDLRQAWTGGEHVVADIPPLPPATDEEIAMARWWYSRFDPVVHPTTAALNRASTVAGHAKSITALGWDLDRMRVWLDENQWKPRHGHTYDPKVRLPSPVLEKLWCVVRHDWPLDRAGVVAALFDHVYVSELQNAGARRELAILFVNKWIGLAFVERDGLLAALELARAGSGALDAGAVAAVRARLSLRLREVRESLAMVGLAQEDYAAVLDAGPDADLQLQHRDSVLFPPEMSLDEATMWGLVEPLAIIGTHLVLGGGAAADAARVAAYTAQAVTAWASGRGALTIAAEAAGAIVSVGGAAAGAVGVEDAFGFVRRGGGGAGTPTAAPLVVRAVFGEARGSLGSALVSAIRAADNGGGGGAAWFEAWTGATPRAAAERIFAEALRGLAFLEAWATHAFALGAGYVAYNGVDATLRQSFILYTLIGWRGVVTASASTLARIARDGSLGVVRTVSGTGAVTGRAVLMAGDVAASTVSAVVAGTGAVAGAAGSLVGAVGSSAARAAAAAAAAAAAEVDVLAARVAQLDVAGVTPVTVRLVVEEHVNEFGLAVMSVALVYAFRHGPDLRAQLAGARAAVAARLYRIRNPDPVQAAVDRGTFEFPPYYDQSAWRGGFAPPAAAAAAPPPPPTVAAAAARALEMARAREAAARRG